MNELRMPSLGADMEFGTLVQWRVKAGAAVKRGDVVAEVETQKGVFEIDIREDATVGELLVAEGTKVKVGAPMALLVPTGVPLPDEKVAAAPPPSMPPAAPARKAAPAVAIASHDGEARGAPSRRPRASPLARRIAAERGIDLSVVTGTGEGGVITRSDVERAVVRVASAETPVVPVPSSDVAPKAAAVAAGMRDAIAAAMTRSKREIPHYYLSEDIELSAATAWLTATNAGRPVTDRILPAAMLLKGVARALTQFPELNGHFVDNAFRPSARIHPGVAITLRGGGLVAPAIHDADRLSLAELMAALADLVRRARQGGLRSSEITDPTITVTNLGEEGVRMVYGVITPPQVAIVGFGSIDQRPWAEDGLIGARPVVTVTLAADHRVSDGWRGARFLRELRRVLGKPEEL
jgi:pyruvate dehydrogenase E2 component (dihydrolipoamide acetyltransferase)